MRFFPAAIAPDEAKARFRPPKTLLSRILPFRTYPPLRHTLLWHPWWLFDFAAEGHEAAVATVAVEAWGGDCRLFTADRSRLIEAAPPGEYFPPRLSDEEALLAARRFLTQATLVLRERRAAKLLLEPLHTECILYPCWVCYYRRGRALAITVGDALHGEPDFGGIRLRNALLQAFAARDRGEI
jgi:hypothetical protein